MSGLNFSTLEIFSFFFVSVRVRMGSLLSRVSPSRIYLPSLQLNITKTCLYNVKPLKPHLYTVKLGFTGVYIIFLISAKT